MTNNNENDIYVIDDEQKDSAFVLPWWIFLLPFLLIGGLAIGFITNRNKPQLATEPGIPSVENTNPDSPPISTDGTGATNPDSPSISTDGTGETNPDSPSISTDGTGENNLDSPPISTDGTGETNPDSPPISTDGTGETNPDSPSISTDGTGETNPDSPLANNNQESQEIKVYFAYKETEVLPSDAPKLESFLSQLPDTAGTLVIAGHSDYIGPDEYNENLSRQRAEQVASNLRELGLGQKYQVKIESWGETKPEGDNNTEQGRAKNRRVVLSFTSAN
ncbi:MAG: OmpA family protein [Cyanobacteria bacterium P01_F01_bin.143]